MPARSVVNSGLALAWVLAVAVAGFVVMALFGWAVDEPARLASRWVVDNLGPWAMLVLIVGGIGALHVAHKRSERADFRRQYAADRTIHVERPSRLPLWFRVVAIGAALAAPVLGIIAVMVAGLSGVTSP